MKILVTGGCGFIGSHVVEHYQEQAEIVVLDNLRTGNLNNLDGLKYHFVEGSILDKSLVKDVMRGVDYVFHLAALVSVPESILMPSETVDINVIGLLNVLEAARQHGARKVCFASSAAVYGENPIQPKVETMIPDPRSPYAITKLDGEYYCGLYARQFGLATTCLRFFNVFGPRQDPKSAYASAVPIFIHRALANEPIGIHGDGGQTRDFIFVKDIVGAMAFTTETEELEGVFNVGYGTTTTILDLAHEIIRLTGSHSKILHESPRLGDIRHSTSSPAKLRDAGWAPSFDLSMGILETLRSKKI